MVNKAGKQLRLKAGQLGFNASSPLTALVFLAVTICLLIGFWVYMNRIKEAIEQAQKDSLWFLGSYFDLKADFLQQGMPDARLREKLEVCGSDFATLSNSGETSAAHLFSHGKFNSLESLWHQVSLLVGGRLDGSHDGKPDSLDSAQKFKSLSESFESSAREWIRFLDAMAVHQIRSVADLQLLLAVAVLVLFGLAGWTLWERGLAGRKAQESRDLLLASLQAQEEERKALALELHDSVAQDLAASLMLARSLESPESGRLKNLIDSLGNSLGRIRQIAWSMRPPELEKQGLSQALVNYYRSFAAQEGLGCDIQLSGDGREPEEKAAFHIYRLLGEAATNIRKHAKASRIRLAISSEAGLYRIRLEDNGLGFDFSAAHPLAAASPEHMGIAGMKERSRLAGGRLSLVSQLGSGTILTIEVPLDA